MRSFNAKSAIVSAALADRILRLQSGFDVPELDVFVPWLITKSELYNLIPESRFSTSVGGCWPQLKFSLYGFDALFDFNFVGSNDGRLTEIQLCNYHPKRLRRTYRISSRFLLEALGRPNLVNMFALGQLTWRFEDLRITTYLSKHCGSTGARGRNVHVLSVSKGLWI